MEKKPDKLKWDYKLTWRDEREIQYCFMQLLREEHMLGGAQHWFSSIMDFLNSEGYEVLRKGNPRAGDE